MSGATTAASADTARALAAHRRLVADKSFQLDFPTYAPSPPPEWLKSIVEFFEWLSPAFPYLFWGVIGLAALTVIWLVVRNLPGFEWLRRRRNIIEPEAAWAPDATAARALLDEAEALAAAGRYAEAARLLLHRSVEDIGRRLPEFLTPALTARDIAAAPALPDAARPAFASIAQVVEVSAFGAQQVSADAWASCRAAYARFALPDSWRVAHG